MARDAFYTVRGVGGRLPFTFKGPGAPRARAVRIADVDARWLGVC